MLLPFIDMVNVLKGIENDEENLEKWLQSKPCGPKDGCLLGSCAV
jgi:hypothetical protein